MAAGDEGGVKSPSGFSKDCGRPGAGELAFSGTDRGLDVAEVRRVGVDLDDDDDLVLVAHGLGVVALHVAARRLDAVCAGISMLTSRSGVADGV